MILTINAGSSSVKLAAFHVRGATPELADEAGLAADPANASAAIIAARVRDAADSMRERLGGAAWTGVAHRVVHGGACIRSAIIDARVRDAIQQATPLAPLHNPLALAVLDCLEQHCPCYGPQFAIFDTEFFGLLPDAASCYALPAVLGRDDALRRRGFHGLAHASLWRQAHDAFGRRDGLRIVSLHLGSGASAAAIRDGRPLDVSMGYSTLEGLVMATRCGDLDPGLILSLLAGGGHDVAGLSDLLARRSGLLGLSGCSSRIGELLTHTDDADCRRAVEIYVHRIRHYIGAYLALLGGADAIVFGGGAGENEPELRRRVVEGFEWAGFALDGALNAARGASGAVGDARTGDARRVLVARVDEAYEMACAALALLRQGAGRPH